MIEKIELWDFENHEHTVVEDLSSGFNLIRGESNAGKTSLVRAVKLVACNQFDPRSVRVGSKNCKVSVTTHRGNVTVTRGKDNVWEVTPTGGVTETFQNIGTKVLAEAQAILGMGLVELGDIPLSVNIMDQLEAHFMLAELEGKKATGSVRAQIIDEISGLAGIEGLIRDVSLDNTRNVREAKRIEEEAKGFASQMHDQTALDVEKALLEQAQQCVALMNARAVEVDEIHQMEQRHAKIRVDKMQAEDALRRLPDVKLVRASHELAQLNFRDANEAMRLASDPCIKAVVVTTKSLSRLPDIKTARQHEKVATDAVFVAQQALSAYSLAQAERKAIAEVNRRISGLPDAKQAGKLLAAADAACSRAAEVRELVSQAGRSLKAIQRVEKEQLKQVCAQLASLTEERDNLMVSFDTCPITLKPITGECLKDIGEKKTTRELRRTAA